MTDHGRPAADPDSQIGAGGDNPSDLLDAQRASAAMRGDTAALRELWHQNRRWVAGVLLAHKPRTIDVEDLLQDVALSMVRRIEDLRDPAALRPWLRQVAINAARAAGRREQVRAPERRGLRLDAPDAPDAPLAAPDAEQSDIAERHEGARLLELARRLPEGYAEPLILKAVRGMSYREIGRVMDLPDTTIETRIARARRMVRELVAQEFGEATAPLAKARAKPGAAKAAKGGADG